MRVYDNSLTPENPLMPDFKVSTDYYQVESGNKYRLGDTEEYFYEKISTRVRIPTPTFPVKHPGEVKIVSWYKLGVGVDCIVGLVVYSQ